MAFDMSTARPVSSGGFDISTAVPVDSLNQAPEGQPSSSTANDILAATAKYSGLGARAVYRGVAGLADAIPGTINAAKIIGDEITGKKSGRLPMPVSEAMDKYLNAINVPQPETTGQRLASDVISGAAGGGAFGVTGAIAGASGMGSSGAARELGAGEFGQTVSGLVGGGLSLKARRMAKAAPQEIIESNKAREMSGPLFKQYTDAGGSLDPSVTNKFIEKVNEYSPTKLDNPLDAKSLENVSYKKTEGGGGAVDTYRDNLIKEQLNQPLTLEGIKKMDETLSDLITNEVRPNGKLTNQGKYLNDIQDSFRQMTEDAAQNDTTGKTAEAFDAWRRGQKIWSNSYKLRDIEDIYKRAETTDNEATSIKTQFAALYRSKKFATYSPEHQALIKKAATRNLSVDALKLIGSRLISTGIGYAGGGVAGAAVAYPIGVGARAAAAKVQGAPGKTLLRSLSSEVSKAAKGPKK